MPKRPTIEKDITARFMEVLGDHVGIGKRFKYKKAFAIAVGMTQPKLNKIENGASIQYRYLVKLHQITSVNLNWLVAGTGEKYSGKSNGTISLEQRVSRIEKTLRIKQ